MITIVNTRTKVTKTTITMVANTMEITSTTITPSLTIIASIIMTEKTMATEITIEKTEKTERIEIIKMSITKESINLEIMIINKVVSITIMNVTSKTMAINLTLNIKIEDKKVMKESILEIMINLKNNHPTLVKMMKEFNRRMLN